jgi:hypothetical protein
MKTAIRFALAAVLLLPTTLIAGRPARAEDWGAIDLVKEGNEPPATGQATLTSVASGGFFLEGGPYAVYAVEQLYGQLTVTCQGLTPGKTYQISPPLGVVNPRNKKPNYFSFRAAADGSGGSGGPIPVVFSIWWLQDPYLGTWGVMDPDGCVVAVSRTDGSRLTLVLTGVLLDPYPNYPYF